MAIVTECKTQECQLISNDPEISRQRRRRFLKQERADEKSQIEYRQYMAYRESMRDLERRKAYAISIAHR